MGIEDKIKEKIMGGAGRLIKGKLQSTIKKLIKEKRLVYLADDKVGYTNRQGEKKTISFDEMTMVLVNASGGQTLLAVGITPENVKEMLVKAGGKREMIKLTAKEIKNVGWNRYFYEKRRYWVAMILFVVGMVGAVLFAQFTKDYINSILRGVGTLGIFILGWVDLIVLYFKSEKAGKKFLEEWEKENYKPEVK